MLPVKFAVVEPPPVVPIILRLPSFSKYWLPTLAAAVAPVSVQLVVADPAVKLLVPFTKIWPWLTNVSSVVNWLALPVSLIDQDMVPVPVACCSVGGMYIMSLLPLVCVNTKLVLAAGLVLGVPLLQ